MVVTEYNEIKLHPGANGLCCRKRHKTDIKHLFICDVKPCCMESQTDRQTTGNNAWDWKLGLKKNPTKANFSSICCHLAAIPWDKFCFDFGDFEEGLGVMARRNNQASGMSARGLNYGWPRAPDQAGWKKHYHNAMLFTQKAYCLMSWPVTDIFRRQSQTRWADRVSQERFDLESPNFTRTSTLTYSTSTPDMASLAPSGWKLSQKKLLKMPPQTALRRISSWSSGRNRLGSIHDAAFSVHHVISLSKIFTPTGSGQISLSFHPSRTD